MTIYNFDKSERFSQLGSIIDNRPDNSQLNPQQSIYDHNSPDIASAEMTALECIRISGAWVTVLLRSDDHKYDTIWSEDIDPTYYTGYDFKAFVPMKPPEIVLTKFGRDAPTSFDMTFSRAELYGTFGERMIRDGDIIIIPHNSLAIRAKRFRVLHATDSGNFRYRFLYYSVSVENVNRDTSFEPKVV
jgi:hypothetical protein